METGSFGHKSRMYGTRFTTGFLSFLKTNELSDVVVVGPEGVEYQLHMLLLAYHSQFFRRAFNSEFREGTEKRITLGFSDPSNMWPLLVEYFYTEELLLTDHNVLALYALARELLVPRIEEYCQDFAQNSLESDNAISYLNQAVMFNCDGFRDSCVRLVAEGFPSSFTKPTDGLPVEVISEILEHPGLVAQTEEQVLSFVLEYVRKHELDEETIRKLFGKVHLAYLSNETLAALSKEEVVPKDMLLNGMAMRLAVIDHPEKLSTLPPPRATYCCSVEYGLPGGSEYAVVPIDAIWEELVPYLRVEVYGEPEGDPTSILRPFDDNTWFAVSGDGTLPVWIELRFPATMRVTEITKYTFSHGMNFANHMFPYGISDSQWFSMKGLATQVCPAVGPEAWHMLKSYESCQAETEFQIGIDASHSRMVAWRRIRICAGDVAGDMRLSIRKLRLYGKVEVSLLRGQEGRELYALFQSKRDGRGGAATRPRPERARSFGSTKRSTGTDE